MFENRAFLSVPGKETLRGNRPPLTSDPATGAWPDESGGEGAVKHAGRVGGTGREGGTQREARVQKGSAMRNQARNPYIYAKTKLESDVE
mgnify:CR=1 FL=1